MLTKDACVLMMQQPRTSDMAGDIRMGQPKDFRTRNNKQAELERFLTSADNLLRLFSAYEVIEATKKANACTTGPMGAPEESLG
jgi:hypothetical protein